MAYKDKLKQQEYNIQYVEKNKEKVNKKKKEWTNNNKEWLAEYKREWVAKRKKEDKDYQLNRNRWHREYLQKLRLIVIKHYSNGSMSCNCCGENHIEFLCIDHINGNGNKHRKEVTKRKSNDSYAWYNWLITNNFPNGFQILCHNCNLSKGYYGYCPHKTPQGGI